MTPRFRFVAALLALCCGCAGISVKTATASIAPRAEASPATLVIGELPRDQAQSPLYVRMQRELEAELQRVAYLLRYRVVEDELVKVKSGDGCFLGLMMSGMIALVPLFFMGLCTDTFEHRLTVEARGYDVSSVNVVQTHDWRSNELVNAFDPKQLFHQFRKEYRLSVEVTAEYDERRRVADSPDVREQVAREAVRQLMVQSTPDVASLLQPHIPVVTRE